MVNILIAAICAGFVGAIYFSVVPAIFEWKGFKVFMEEFFLGFIICAAIGFMGALVLRG